MKAAAAVAKVANQAAAAMTTPSQAAAAKVANQVETEGHIFLRHIIEFLVLNHLEHLLVQLVIQLNLRMTQLFQVTYQNYVLILNQVHLLVQLVKPFIMNQILIVYLAQVIHQIVEILIRNINC